jgi:hypothetical protein
MRRNHLEFGRYRAIGLWMALFFLFLASGCATLFSRKEDTITIKTEPPGAEVYLGTQSLGTTPFTHTFKRDTFEQKRLSLRKEGYKTRELDLGRTLDPKALFNLGYFLTTAGVSSWATDAMSGAMIRYSPDSYYLDLEPENRPPDTGEQAQRSRRAFVVVNHDPLKRDIARGGGAYLSAYHALLDPPGRQEMFLLRVKESAAELLSQEDGVDFSEALERAMTQGSESPSSTSDSFLFKAEFPETE